jgi:hypothetical protein
MFARVMHGRPSHTFHGLMAAFFLWVATTAEAEVTLPDILASRMVVQRDMPVPVWGTARKGETVTVTFRDQIKTAVADANGKWILRLDPLTAGGPDTMTLAGSDKDSKVITLEDVLVGEVWMGSGQSNMNHFASLIFKDADDLGQPRDAQLEQDVAQTWPTIRLFQRPSKDTTWKLSEPENNLKFSGLLFEFGVQLQKELKVPIGLIKRPSPTLLPNSNFCVARHRRTWTAGNKPSPPRSPTRCLRSACRWPRRRIERSGKTFADSFDRISLSRFEACSGTRESRTRGLRASISTRSWAASSRLGEKSGIRATFRGSTFKNPAAMGVRSTPMIR